jgi:centrosomal protein CEP76
VQPIRPGRLLRTPYEAARFVSLIPYSREESLGGGRMEIWTSMHSFLAKGRGERELLLFLLVP